MSDDILATFFDQEFNNKETQAWLSQSFDKHPLINHGQ